MEAQTPYGPVNLHESRFGSDPAPLITTLKPNYGASVRDSYLDIVNALVPEGLKGRHEKTIASELLKAIRSGQAPEGGKITSGEQRNAAAKLLAITHFAEPERVAGSSKHARALLREIGRGENTFANAFVGATGHPDFTVAETPTHARKALSGSATDNLFRELNKDFSDDSDVEGARRKPALRSSKK